MAAGAERRYVVGAFALTWGELTQGLDGFLQLGQSLFCSLQGFVAEVEGAGVVTHQHEKAHRHGTVPLVQKLVVARDEFFGREPVALGLGHFASVDRQHVAVHPVVDRAFATGGADVLGDFTFVVGKLQVHSTAVDVKLLTEVFGAHHRTLEMPSRKALSPRRRPLHQVTGVCGFPKGKVKRIPLFALAVKVSSVVHQLVDLSP